MTKNWKLTDHHIWCNFASSKHPDECQQCKTLKKDFPRKEGQSELDTMKEYFPQNVRRI